MVLYIIAFLLTCWTVSVSSRLFLYLESKVLAEWQFVWHVVCYLSLSSFVQFNFRRQHFPTFKRTSWQCCLQFPFVRGYYGRKGPCSLCTACLVQASFIPLKMSDWLQGSWHSIGLYPDMVTLSPLPSILRYWELHYRSSKGRVLFREYFLNW